MNLIGGPYSPPPGLKNGDWITCEVRGRVKSGGYAETGPIGPWPCLFKTGRVALIVTPDLARALRVESSKAIQHWWGVSGGVVWAWRKALGIGEYTPGTRQLHREALPDKLPPDLAEKGRKRALAPKSIEKMRRTKVGKPAHPATKASLLASAKKPKPPGWGKRANEWMRAGQINP